MHFDLKMLVDASNTAIGIILEPSIQAKAQPSYILTEKIIPAEINYKVYDNINASNCRSLCNLEKDRWKALPFG